MADITDAGEQDAKAAFEQFQSAAMALTNVVSFPGQPFLVLSNAEFGVRSVEPHEARIKVELPAVKFVVLLEIRQIALGLTYCVARVDRTLLDRPMSKEELKEATAEGYEERGLLLDTVRLLARAGLVPKDRVTLIEKGSGKLDMVSDVTQLVALCEEHLDVVLAKSPITKEQLAQDKQLGAKLARAFRPEGARGPDLAEESRKSVEMRDRMWTLLKMRHDELRRVGAWLFGMDEVDEKVPVLLSAKRPAGKAQGTPDKG